MQRLCAFPTSATIMESSRIRREHPLYFVQKSGSTLSYDRTRWSVSQSNCDSNVSHVLFMAESLPLSEQQRVDLNNTAQSRSLPTGFAFRAKLILRWPTGSR